MNTIEVRKQWEIFKIGFPRIDRQNRFMKLNEEFALDPWFYQDDLDEMRKHLEATLEAIKIIREELQR